jgi:ABC-type sulfate transport system permease subunit
MSEKRETVTEKVEEVVEEAVEKAESSATDKLKSIKEDVEERVKNIHVEEELTTLSDKIKSFVIKFGTILITLGVVLGLAKSIVSGFVAMGDNFLNGLFSMFFSVSAILVGAFVIFLLIEIKDQLIKLNEKK